MWFESFGVGKQSFGYEKTKIDFSKYEVGVPIRIELFDIFQLLKSVISVVDTMAFRKSVHFYVTTLLPIHRRWIETDPNCLKQVLLNVLSNAIKVDQV